MPGLVSISTRTLPFPRLISAMVGAFTYSESPRHPLIQWTSLTLVISWVKFPYGIKYMPYEPMIIIQALYPFKVYLCGSPSMEIQRGRCSGYYLYPQGLKFITSNNKTGTSYFSSRASLIFIVSGRWEFWNLI